MNIDDYQKQANVTAIYPEWCRVIYPAMQLQAEAGEAAQIVAKKCRNSATDEALPIDLSEAERSRILDELGDVLWYVAATASDLGAALSEIADANIAKLKMRAERGEVGKR